jgi:hypothetical protein
MSFSTLIDLTAAVDRVRHAMALGRHPQAAEALREVARLAREIEATLPQPKTSGLGMEGLPIPRHTIS